MESERKIFLKGSNTSSKNKANGYYDRHLGCSLGNLRLSVPRGRLGEFRPFLLLEPYQRTNEDMEDVLINLVLCSYLPNRMKSFLNSIGLPYTKEEIEEIKEEILN